PRSLRFETEQRALQTWLEAVQRCAATNYDLAVEVAACRNLVKGYGDTHERGGARFDELMRVLPELTGRADAPRQLARLRKAANADETGLALTAAIAALRSEQAEAVSKV